MDLLLGLCSDMELCRRIRNQCVQTAKHLCVLVCMYMCACACVCRKVEGQVLKQKKKKTCVEINLQFLSRTKLFRLADVDKRWLYHLFF